MIRDIRIAPSILAADFARLGESIDLLGSEVDMVHLDVMDGHFVPNISLGPPVVASLRAVTNHYLDCHLMITDPIAYVAPLAEAGANGVTAHIEAVPDPRPVAREAARLGIDFGLVINPSTPAEAVIPFLDLCSMVVVMSVHPGFGGQSFINDVVPKITQLRESVDSMGLATDIEVDGGIDEVTAVAAARAGASVLVAGTSVFRSDDPAQAVRTIRAFATGEER
jgi:ribulose-phosphate 3-epimerase